MRASQVFVFEPPSGVIASLKQTMATVNRARMGKEPVQRAKLHFMLAWFHAVTVDRLRFSPLGWANKYEFGTADQRTAFNCFDAWIDRVAGGKRSIDIEAIPWTALKISLGQVFYGGRVDNVFDQYDAVLDPRRPRFIYAGIRMTVETAPTRPLPSEPEPVDGGGDIQLLEEP